MEDRDELVVLVENTTYTPFLCAKHGLAFALLHRGQWLLVDTGPDDTVVDNARRLSVPLERVEHMVLTHGHYDHGGGLASLASQISHPHLWMHPDALLPKYRRDGSFIGVRLPPSWENTLRPLEKPTEILPGVWVVPSITVTYDDDLHGDGLFVERNGVRVEDDFEDEVYVVVDHGESVTLISGCSHRGISNIIEDAMRLFERPFDLVIGGFHLRHSPPDLQKRVVQRLASYPVGQYGVCHCTGLEAYHLMREVLQDRVMYASAGSRFPLGL